MRKVLLYIVTLLAILSSCNDDAAVEQNGLLLTRSAISDSLTVNTSFIKLADDTTRLEAGFLEITAPTQEVSIKWNVLPGFNIDTTATTIQMRDGKVSLPIKWKNCLKSHKHAPQDMNFQGGVIVIAGNEAKYVRLILAEKVDSVKLSANPVVMASPEAPYPAPRAVSAEPPVLTLHPTVSSGMYVNPYNSLAVLDFTSITPDLNIDLSQINVDGPSPNLIIEPTVLRFVWTPAGPPPFSFYRRIRITQGDPAMDGTIFNAYIYYSAPGDPVFRLISVLPDKPGFISGENGLVEVKAETNGEWSVGSSLNKDANDIVDVGIGTLVGRELKISIQDNNTSSRRKVTIITKSKGVEKDVTDIYQQGGDPNLFLRYEISTIVTPIPKAGGTYTITFTGDYEGPLLVRPVIAGVPGTPGPVTNTKTAIVTIPENPTTADRNITFEFSVDGENWVGRRWAAVSPETDRIQLGANGGGEVSTLEYEKDNLPEGNIPQLGKEYTFDFKGTYKGRLRVRASVNGTWYTGNMSSILHASIDIPANVTANVLPVRFQYRAFDATPSTWINLPDTTKRNQDALTISGTVTPGPLLPDTALVAEFGAQFSCKFTGTFNGTIKMRAITGTPETALATAEGKVGDNIFLDIPQLIGSNRMIVFQYSIDGGQTWINLDEREQKNETLSTNQLLPITDIPAEGGTYTIKMWGTYSKTVTVMAKKEDAQGNKIVLTQETSKVRPEHVFKLVVPANDSVLPRAVAFSYRREDQDQTKEAIIGIKIQAGKKK